MSVLDLLSWIEEQPAPEGLRKSFHRRNDNAQLLGGTDLSNSTQQAMFLREPSSAGRPLDINRASAQEWDELPGFGPVLSQRTVKYREALGGFVDVNQLHQVYGLDSAVIERLRDRLVVDVKAVRVVCLDTVTFRFLIRHPLFDADATRRVLRAWGRGPENMDQFWSRLNPSEKEREEWTPYLGSCKLQIDGHE